MKKITVILVLWILLLASCTAKKPIREQNETLITKSDSTRITETTKTVAPIRDTTLFAVPDHVATANADCDSIARDAITKYLKGLNTKKSSGNTGYGIYYDKYRKLLVMYNNLSETIDHSKETEHTEAEVKVKVITVTVPELYTPLWMQILAGIGGATVVVAAVWIIAKIKK